MNWAELALPAEVVAAAGRDGVNGDMVRELKALLHGAVFARALKVRGRLSCVTLVAWNISVRLSSQRLTALARRHTLAQCFQHCSSIAAGVRMHDECER